VRYQVALHFGCGGPKWDLLDARHPAFNPYCTVYGVHLQPFPARPKPLQIEHGGPLLTDDTPCCRHALFC
jgi:hypothetical protein